MTQWLFRHQTPSVLWWGIVNGWLPDLQHSCWNRSRKITLLPVESGQISKKSLRVRLVRLEHILYYIYHALSCYLCFVMTYRYNILWTLAINSNLWLVHETLSKHLNPEDAKPDDAARQRVMILVSGEGNPFFFSYFVGIWRGQRWAYKYFPMDSFWSDWLVASEARWSPRSTTFAGRANARLWLPWHGRLGYPTHRCWSLFIFIW